MSETKLLAASLVLMLVPFGLIAYGILEGIPLLWWAGLVMLVLGGVIPPITRYAFDDEDDGENKGENGDGGGETGSREDGKTDGGDDAIIGRE